MTRGGANGCHSTSSDSNTSGCFGTTCTKLNRMSDFSDDSCAGDKAYEGADQKEIMMGQIILKDNHIHKVPEIRTVAELPNFLA